MSVPNHPDKYTEPSVLKAADVLAYRLRNRKATSPSLPEAVVLCYQPSLVGHAIKRYRSRKIVGFFGDVYALRAMQDQVAVCGNFGVGAPVVGTLVEELAAAGARRFLSIGIAGGLQPHLAPGDVVVCDRAIRDEGTSQHYLPLARPAEANRDLTEALTGALTHSGISFSIGASWTTDAPYRETRAEIEAYQQQGIHTVDMEAAALYAVSQYLRVQAAAVFVISDSLAKLQWQPAPDGRLVQKTLQAVFDAAIRMFQP